MGMSFEVSRLALALRDLFFFFGLPSTAETSLDWAATLIRGGTCPGATPERTDGVAYVDTNPVDNVVTTEVVTVVEVMDGPLMAI